MVKSIMVIAALAASFAFGQSETPINRLKTTGPMNAGGNVISNLAPGAASSDAATAGQVNTSNAALQVSITAEGVLRVAGDAANAADILLRPTYPGTTNIIDFIVASSGGVWRIDWQAYATAVSNATTASLTNEAALRASGDRDGSNNVTAAIAAIPTTTNVAYATVAGTAVTVTGVQSNTLATALQPGATNGIPHSSLSGIEGAGTLHVSVSETNLIDGALQRSGGTMTGILDMDAYRIDGRRFGYGAGENASGSGWSAYGFNAGFGAEGNAWNAYGLEAGFLASGNSWGAYGLSAGVYAIHTNSHSFGLYAGYNARGNSRMYLDVMSINPDYPAGGATNDTIFMDTDGKLYLGGGAGRSENPSAGGVLRGTWDGAGVANIPISGVTGLQGALDGKVATNGFTDAIHGIRGGLNLHTLADANGAGFYSADHYKAVQSMKGRTNVWDSAVTNGQTNVVLGLASGTTVTRPMEADQPASKAYVDGLIPASVLYYVGTNTYVTGDGQTNFLFQTTIPPAGTRTYTAVSTGQYLGSCIITNLDGFSTPTLISSWQNINTVSGKSASIHAEDYYSIDNGTNWLGDWESESRAMTATAARYDYSISGSPYKGKCIKKRVFKVTAASGGPNFILSFGTGKVSTIQFDVPAATPYVLTAEGIAAAGGQLAETVVTGAVRTVTSGNRYFFTTSTNVTLSASLTGGQVVNLAKINNTATNSISAIGQVGWEWTGGVMTNTITAGKSMTFGFLVDPSNGKTNAYVTGVSN
jgi:hypothetical protein